MNKFFALTLTYGTIALSACAEIPKCSDSTDLDCNKGAYSEERTYENMGHSTSNINPAAGEPSVEEAPAAPPSEPVFEAPGAEPITEVTPEPIAVPEPTPAPADAKVMRKADETPAMKSMK